MIEVLPCSTAEVLPGDQPVTSAPAPTTTATPAPTKAPAATSGGLTTCSSNAARYAIMSAVSTECAYIGLGDWQVPLPIADTDDVILNEVAYYRCPSFGLRTMRVLDFTERAETSNVLGFAVNGVIAFNPLEEESMNAAEPSAGGTIQDGQYWYGLQQDRKFGTTMLLGWVSRMKEVLSETQLGHGMDGFPIYGPVSDPDTQLDDCNFDSSTGRYHICTLD